MATTFAYSLAASTIVGDLLISLRSVYLQDKSLAIGFSMTLISVLAYVPGKVAYDQISKYTCQHWTAHDGVCHLHHPEKLGDYLCYLTAGLLATGALFKALVWFFTRKLNLYDTPKVDTESGRELEDLTAFAQTESSMNLKLAVKAEPKYSPINTDDIGISVFIFGYTWWENIVWYLINLLYHCRWIGESGTESRSHWI